MRPREVPIHAVHPAGSILATRLSLDSTRSSVGPQIESMPPGGGNPISTPSRATETPLVAGPAKRRTSRASPLKKAESGNQSCMIRRSSRWTCWSRKALISRRLAPGRFTARNRSWSQAAPGICTGCCHTSCSTLPGLACTPDASDSGRNRDCTGAVWAVAGREPSRARISVVANERFSLEPWWIPRSRMGTSHLSRPVLFASGITGLRAPTRAGWIRRRCPGSSGPVYRILGVSAILRIGRSAALRRIVRFCAKP